MHAPVPFRQATRSRRLAVSFSLSLAIALALAPTASAQVAVEGIAASAQTLPPGTSQSLHTSSGLVTFDGVAVTRTAPGQPPQTLLTTSGVVFGSFLLETGPNHVLFGLTGIVSGGANDAIWLLPTQGPVATQPLAMVPYNYDATMLTPTTVLLSARTGGFGATNNELWVLDLPTGTTQLVASIPGASGPVTIAPNGDVFYATGFAGWPPLPGTATVLRFSRAVFDQAVLTNTVLGQAHTQVVVSGLDAVSDFVFDNDGDLLFVDWFNNRIGEINDADGPQPWVGAPLVDYATAAVSPTSLQAVVGASAAGVFEPFQPANGRVLVHETNYVTTQLLRELTPARATMSATGGSPVPAGPFDFVTSGGPALGLGVVALQFGSIPGVLTISVPGFEQPLFLDATLASNPVLLTVLFDANGASTLSLANPGIAPAVLLSAQVVFGSTSGVLGSTAATTALLGP